MTDPASAPYDYRVARIIRVVDGDTYDLVVDVGFRFTAALRFRLLGVDTPELNSPNADERERAKAAKAFAGAWLDDRLEEGLELRAATYKGDAFGRWVANIYATDPGSGTDARELAVALLDAGHARTWPALRTLAVLGNAGDPIPEEDSHR